MFWESFRPQHPGLQLFTNSDGIRKAMPWVPLRMAGFPLAMFTCQIEHSL